MNPAQQRQDERYQLRCPVKLWVFDEDNRNEEAFIVLGYTTSVSLGGVFFTSRSLLLSESASVRIELELPGEGGVIRADGRVARYFKLPATDAHAYEPGMGIQFVGLTEEDAARLADVLHGA